MLRMRNLPHLLRPSSGPLTLAVLGLTLAGGGALKSAHAGDYVPTSTASLREVKAHSGMKLTAGVYTYDQTGLSRSDTAPDVTYSWRWDGIDTAPNAHFTKTWDVIYTGATATSSLGVSAWASGSVSIGLRDAYGNDLVAVNSPPNSVESTNGAVIVPPESGNPTANLVVPALAPENQRGQYILRVVAHAYAGSGAGIEAINGPTPQTEGTADGGLQKATPTTQSLLYPR